MKKFSVVIVLTMVLSLALSSCSTVQPVLKPVCDYRQDIYAAIDAVCSFAAEKNSAREIQARAHLDSLLVEMQASLQQGYVTSTYKNTAIRQLPPAQRLDSLLTVMHQSLKQTH